MDTRFKTFATFRMSTDFKINFTSSVIVSRLVSCGRNTAPMRSRRRHLIHTPRLNAGIAQKNNPSDSGCGPFMAVILQDVVDALIVIKCLRPNRNYPAFICKFCFPHGLELILVNAKTLFL